MPNRKSKDAPARAKQKKKREPNGCSPRKSKHDGASILDEVHSRIASPLIVRMAALARRLVQVPAAPAENELDWSAVLTESLIKEFLILPRPAPDNGLLEIGVVLKNDISKPVLAGVLNVTLIAEFLEKRLFQVLEKVGGHDASRRFAHVYGKTAKTIAREMSQQKFVQAVSEFLWEVDFVTRKKMRLFRKGTLTKERNEAAETFKAQTKIRLGFKKLGKGVTNNRCYDHEPEIDLTELNYWYSSLRSLKKASTDSAKVPFLLHLLDRLQREKPSNVALQVAAMMCGAPSDYYTLGYLRKKVKLQRRQAKSASR